jgi:hypothetical protein
VAERDAFRHELAEVIPREQAETARAVTELRARYSRAEQEVARLRDAAVVRRSLMLLLRRRPPHAAMIV